MQDFVRTLFTIFICPKCFLLFSAYILKRFFLSVFVVVNRILGSAASAEYSLMADIEKSIVVGSLPHGNARRIRFFGQTIPIRIMSDGIRKQLSHTSISCLIYRCTVKTSKTNLEVKHDFVRLKSC
jgi:hypothetical protein